MNGFVFDINSYLRLVPTDMLLICISTLLIVLIAKHFFWDKVTVYLNARSEVIQGDLDAAKAAKAEGAQYKQQYEEQLASVKAEAHALMETAKKNANEEKREILADARRSADLMKEKAAADIEREKVLARKQIKNEITEVAFLAAGKIVEKELDEATHKQYVKDFIEQAGEDTWHA